jgi:hypothetical protein
MDNWWKTFSEIPKCVAAEEFCCPIGSREIAFESCDVLVVCKIPFLSLFSCCLLVYRFKKGKSIFQETVLNAFM